MITPFLFPRAPQRAWALVLALLAGVVAAPLHAEGPRDPFRERLQEGLARYDAQAYEQAIASFEEAYRLRQEPRALYLLGQACRKAGRHEAARARLREFLLVASPSRDAEFIRTAEDYLRRADPIRAAPLSVPVPARVPLAAAPLRRPAGAVGKSPLYRKWWLWTAVAVGVAGSVAAIAGAAAPRETLETGVLHFGVRP